MKVIVVAVVLVLGDPANPPLQRSGCAGR